MILSGLPAAEGPVVCDGLLLIGDPHVGSRRPGRRKDLSWPAPVLAKLERCVEIANGRCLAPVILGDLFEQALEPDEALKGRLVRILKRFRLRPLVNVGNHDMRHTRLSEGDSLSLLGTADVVDVAPLSGPARVVEIGGRRFGLGLTPYGQPIPTDVRGAFPQADAVVWFTHHDIAFADSYPGAVPPHAVAGCDIVVNGHVHALKPPVTLGATTWTNPGNITRRTIDDLDHVPRAWVVAADGSLSPEILPFAADVFDLTGRLVEAAEADLSDSVESAFVSLLKAESATDLRRSADGSLLREEIEAKFERDGTSEPVRRTVLSLLAEAVARRTASA
jgi:hypothetical protein